MSTTTRQTPSSSSWTWKTRTMQGSSRCRRSWPPHENARVRSDLRTVSGSDHKSFRQLSEAGEAFLDLRIGESVVLKGIPVFRGARTLLTRFVTRRDGAAAGIGELDAEVPVDVLDDFQWVGGELEVVEIVELRRVLFGAFGVEQLQAARPRLQRVLTDHLTAEAVRPSLGRVLG